MEKFKFSLAKVLEYRQAEEAKAKREYGQAQRELIEVEKRLQEKRAEKAALLDIQERTLERMQVQHWYVIDLNEQICEVIKDVQKLQGKAQKKLMIYISAQKERKILEKLAEKQWMEYQQQVNREEQKRLDELARPKKKIS